MVTLLRYSQKEFYGVKDTLEGTLPQEVLTIISSISSESKFNHYRKDHRRHYHKRKQYQREWRQCTPKSVIGLPAKTPEEKVNREVNSWLNKLSETNFDTIFQNLIKILKENNTQEIMKQTLNNIFDKAICQPFYCPLYVKICKRLIKLNAEVIRLIDQKCTRYCTMIHTMSLNGSNGTQVVQSDVPSKQTYDDYCEQVKEKSKTKGFTQFIGELYMNAMVEKQIIDTISTLFVKNIHDGVSQSSLPSIKVEMDVMCLCTMLKTIQKNISEFHDYKETINDFSKNRDLPPKCRFMFMDTYELFA